MPMLEEDEVAGEVEGAEVEDVVIAVGRLLHK